MYLRSTEHLCSLKHTEKKETGQGNCMLWIGSMWVGLCTNTRTHIDLFFPVWCVYIWFSRMKFLHTIRTMGQMLWFLRVSANFTSLFQGFQKHLIEQRQHFNADPNFALAALLQIGHNARYIYRWMWLFCVVGFFEQTKTDVKNNTNSVVFKFSTLFSWSVICTDKGLFLIHALNKCLKVLICLAAFNTSFINSYTVLQSLFNNASASGWQPAVLFHVTAIYLLL